MNGRYTVWDNPRIDQFVEAHLGEIVSEVAALMNDRLHAIILGGGFGRGEGSILIQPDGSLHVVNDYDLEVVYRERWGSLASKLINRLRFKKKLDRLEKDLAARLNVKQLDLGLRGLSAYAKVVTPKLADFDLQYGHRVLYGTGDPVASMRPFKATEIPAFEGTWLLRNRGIGLLLARLYANDGEVRNEKLENFYIEINKAVLAMGDALFILNGRYICSYAERADKIGELADNGFASMPELLRLYPLAAQYKLRPRLLMYPDTPPPALWRDVTRLYISFFLFHESRRLRTSFTNLAHYSQWALDHSPRGVGRFSRLVFDILAGAARGLPVAFQNIKYDKYRSIAFTFMLLHCGQEKDPPENYTRLLWKLAGKHRANLTQREWAELARDFLLLIHPAGEVGRFLSGGQ